MSVKLLTESHLELLSLKSHCTDLSESTLAKMPHCWKYLSRLKCMFQEQERDCSFMVELNAPTDGSELGKMSKTVVTLVNDDGKFIEQGSELQCLLKVKQDLSIVLS